MYVLVLVIVSLVMAWVLQTLFKSKEIPGGYWNRLVGAIVGALLGDLILGEWGWMLAGYNVFAGIIAAFLIGWLYIYILNKQFSESKSSDKSA